MTTAYVDTSPLQWLHRAGRLPLLLSLFDRVVVTKAVVAENERGAREGYAVPDLGKTKWIKVEEVRDLALPADIPGCRSVKLDLGEKETLAAAYAAFKASPGDPPVLVLDEKIGRRCAASLGIEALRTQDVLLLAKKRRKLKLVRPSLERLAPRGLGAADSPASSRTAR